MKEYRAYLMGPDGHIKSRVDLICADEEAAKEHAKQLVDGHDVELRQLDRKIATFTHNQKAASVCGLLALMSLFGTFETCQGGLMMSVQRGRPEVTGRRSNAGIDPSRT